MVSYKEILYAEGLDETHGCFGEIYMTRSLQEPSVFEDRMAIGWQPAKSEAIRISMTKKEKKKKRNDV